MAKILAARGVCSRREAESLIAAGCVRVDGVVVAQQGAKAALDAVIDISAAGRKRLSQRVAIALHKPAGIVSALPQGGQRAALSLVVRSRLWSKSEREGIDLALGNEDLAVAGRLDRASRGLLILTDDGVVARALVGGNAITKRYVVGVGDDVSRAQLDKLNRPMRIDQRNLRPMKVRRCGERRLRFELMEGMKHQIRRCCQKVGVEVTDLLRDSIGPVELGALPEGQWRMLAAGEVAAIRAVVVSSPQGGTDV